MGTKIQAIMSSIFEMIKRNAVPATVMRTAAKGALPVPADQMLEILVYLTQNPVFAQDARMTLASFDLPSTLQIAASPQAAPEVLGYYWSEENRRPALMPALIENPAITDSLLMELAGEAPREILNMLLASPRVRGSYPLMEALKSNPHLSAGELRKLNGEPEEPEPAVDSETEALHQSYQQQHAAEIAAEEGKAFALVEGEPDPVSQEPAAAGQSASGSEALAAAAMSAHNRSMAASPEEEKKMTLLQRVGRMTASERVKAAFTGSREERAILIRDGARIVQNAVLSSPKLTDPEVELFAAAKNVHDNVLREIARSRRFMRNYSVVRNLVQNPKTPVDIALPLVKMLMVFDLKSLQRSRNVSETIRNLAARYYREKALSGGRTKE
ncbi:MAG TPA: hypothetical protein VFW31_02810 [Candidatus Angelobacter sp.]|nr:hypothetical protein [Candidatus Angelobacter sp.]